MPSSDIWPPYIWVLLCMIHSIKSATFQILRNFLLTIYTLCCHWETGCVQFSIFMHHLNILYGCFTWWHGKCYEWQINCHSRYVIIPYVIVKFFSSLWHAYLKLCIPCTMMLWFEQRWLNAIYVPNSITDNYTGNIWFKEQSSLY